MPSLEKMLMGKPSMAVLNFGSITCGGVSIPMLLNTPFISFAAPVLCVIDESEKSFFITKMLMGIEPGLIAYLFFVLPFDTSVCAVLSPARNFAQSSPTYMGGTPFCDLFSVIR